MSKKRRCKGGLRSSVRRPGKMKENGENHRLS